MTHTKTTTETSHYFKVVTALVALAMVASLLVVMSAAPAHATTTFTVNVKGDTADTNPGDGTCSILGSFCSLRAAIQEANATPGPDTINFDVNTAGDGLATISPESPLPTITDRVTVDGYSQTGASPNTAARGTNAQLKVELDGTGAEAASGLQIDAGGSGSVIRGLVINRFSNQGIEIIDTGTRDVRLSGNFVGTDVSGTTALGNRGDGIEFDASDSVIGGPTLADRNLISGNEVDGLSISNGDNVVVRGNLIGTRRDGLGKLGNGFSGIDVDSTSVGNRILGNAIFSNGQLGIDLGVGGRTLNDPGDTDTGANDLQNFPVISSAITVSGKTTIAGRLNSNPNKTFRIQFFSNPRGTNEGRKLIGQKSVTTSTSGKANFTFSPKDRAALGQTITATATGPSGTSEFSAPRTVVSS